MLIENKICPPEPREPLQLVVQESKSASLAINRRSLEAFSELSLRRLGLREWEEEESVWVRRWLQRGQPATFSMFALLLLFIESDVELFSSSKWAAPIEEGEKNEFADDESGDPRRST